MSDEEMLPLDAFATLGIEPCFGLDLPALEQTYLEAQQRVHPDRLKTSPLAQQVATRLSSQVTQAYHRLKDPLTRAEALFQAKKVWPLPPVEACGTELLEEMMELQEQAEQQAQNAPEFITHLETLTQKAYTNLDAIFKTKLDLEKASYAYHRFAYLQKLKARLAGNLQKMLL
ncbi:MAG: iron-sulfur cluster co-chaperone HscB C-terminal domain-containing protein [Alphaproteobacteria bacterium]